MSIIYIVIDVKDVFETGSKECGLLREQFSRVLNQYQDNYDCRVFVACSKQEESTHIDVITRHKWRALVYQSNESKNQALVKVLEREVECHDGPTASSHVSGIVSRIIIIDSNLKKDYQTLNGCNKNTKNAANMSTLFYPQWRVKEAQFYTLKNGSGKDDEDYKNCKFRDAYDYILYDENNDFKLEKVRIAMSPAKFISYHLGSLVVEQKRMSNENIISYLCCIGGTVSDDYKQISRMLSEYEVDVYGLEFPLDVCVTKDNVAIYGTALDNVFCAALENVPAVVMSKAKSLTLSA